MFNVYSITTVAIFVDQIDQESPIVISWIVCKFFNWIICQYFANCDLELTEKEHIYYRGTRLERNVRIKFKQLIATCPRLRRFRSDIVPIEWNLSQLSQIHSLEVFEIDWRKKKYRFLGLDILLSKCVNLRELGLIGYDCEGGIQYKPRGLTSLCLDYCNIPFQDVLELVIINGQTLTRLEYHNLTDNLDGDLNKVLIDTIGQYCSQLVTLRLYINDTPVEGLKRLTSLKNLFLIMNISGKDVQALMRNNPKLRWMVVHQKEINYCEVLIFCMKFCKSMEQISINNDRIPVFSEHEVRLWKALPSLKLIHGRPLEYYENNLVTFASD